MVKKFLMLSGLIFATALAKPERSGAPKIGSSIVRAVPGIAMDVTIAYNNTAKKIGYTPSGAGAKFVDCSGGFTIDSGVVTWDVDPAAKDSKGKVFTVTGPITFAGAGVELKLNQNLQFSGAGRFVSVNNAAQNVTRTENSSAVAFLTVDAKNSASFTSGFAIPAYTRVTWSVSAAAVTGAITIADSSSLILAADLKLGQVTRPTPSTGSIAAEQFPRIVLNEFAIYKPSGRVLFAPITDTNYKTYRDGFTIPAATTYSWATVKPLQGEVTFTADNDAPAQLFLQEDLHLGRGASLVASDDNFCSIVAVNAAEIVLDDDTTLQNSLKSSNSLTVNGKGNALGLGVWFEKFELTGSGDDGLLTLKNMELQFDNNNITFDGICQCSHVVLNDVVIRASSANQSDSKPLCKNNCTVTMRGMVDFVGSGSNVLLFTATPGTLEIAPESMLHIGQGVTFEITRSEGTGPLSFTADKTSLLSLEGCTLYLGNKNLDLGDGLMDCGRDVTIYCSCKSFQEQPGMLTYKAANRSVAPGASITVRGTEQAS